MWKLPELNGEHVHNTLWSCVPAWDVLETWTHSRWFVCAHEEKVKEGWNSLSQVFPNWLASRKVPAVVKRTLSPFHPRGAINSSAACSLRHSKLVFIKLQHYQVCLEAVNAAHSAFGEIKYSTSHSTKPFPVKLHVRTALKENLHFKWKGKICFCRTSWGWQW